ncbi:MAG: pyridoxal phosphate-dependent decarboxylase family protein [Ardenticatenaceae bacterium]
MNKRLDLDAQQLQTILARVTEEASDFWRGLPERAVGTSSTAPGALSLPADGVGALKALALFRERFAEGLSGSAGGRYFGFVTGGATPASIAGDWLTTIYDQNALGSSESNASWLELETLAFLRELFQLPEAYTGTFVTGATMSNFVGLALGRQWVGHQHGVNVAQEGVAACPPIRVLSGTPHSSIYKALSMLGMGRACVESVACLPNREAVDVAQLAQRLQELAGEPCIVVANAGTVNTVDYDDLQAIVDLKAHYPFWLHLDGAFGGFAACSPAYRHFVAGMEQTDSITIDAHKWLNVPYDSAMQFTRHHTLQAEVFQNAAVYLDQTPSQSSFVHLTPENSRRLRALPAWFSLIAYGRNGYQEIIERDSRLAQTLGAKIDTSPHFRLLAPVRLNGICFTLNIADNKLTLAQIRHFLQILTDSGLVFLTPTLYKNVPAIRVSVTNWQTTQNDIEIAWQALLDAWATFQKASP